MFSTKTILALTLSASIAGPTAFADAYPNCADIQVNQLVDEETAKFAALQPFDEYVQFNCLDKNHVLRTNGVNFFQVNDTLKHEVYYGFPTDAARPPAKQIVPVAVTHHFWQSRVGAAVVVAATVVGVIAARRYLRTRSVKGPETSVEETAVEPTVADDVIITPAPRPRAFVLSPDFVTAEEIGFSRAEGQIPVSKLVLARSSVPQHIPTYTSSITNETYLVQLNPEPFETSIGHNRNLEAVRISSELESGQTASSGYWMSNTWSPEVYAQRATGGFGFRPTEGVETESLEPATGASDEIEVQAPQSPSDIDHTIEQSNETPKF